MISRFLQASSRVWDHKNLEDAGDYDPLGMGTVFGLWKINGDSIGLFDEEDCDLFDCLERVCK